VQKNIVYGQGLTHSNWNKGKGTPMDLTLDAYVPKGAPAEGKPAWVVIHGGGFVGGSPTQGQIVKFCEYFAERGFVSFSVDYRVAKHRGTIPEAWSKVTSKLVKVDQLNAMYPAGRDIKAAVRWIRANASEYGIHTDFLAATGGSAGAFLSIMLAATNDSDYRDEITAEQDPTLASTHLKQSANVKAIVDLWGGVTLVDALKTMDGKSRWDSTDAPVLIIHGVDDEAVPFTQAETLKSYYDETGVYYEYHPVQAGHGAWSAKIDGAPLWAAAFKFITKQMKLTVTP